MSLLGIYTWEMLHGDTTELLIFLSSLKLYVDLPSYLSLYFTRDIFRRGMHLVTAENCMYIIELTVGFQTNLDDNAGREEDKYAPLLRDLNEDYG